jgi:FtsP/CotA-like multicopper oxidase with cupredoxin domain
MDINWKFKVGDKVKIRIYNDPNSMHPMQHPIHFHGQRFLVVSQNGDRPDNMVWKDTAMVRTGEYIDIVMDITNP